MRVLVAGWFSFEAMGATAGDLMARDVVARWLTEARVPHDTAIVPPYGRGVDWASVDPSRYSHVVFVCGPFGNGPPVDEFLRRFGGRRLIGVDLSMLQDLEAWNPFDLLLERDSSRCCRPDLTFLSEPARVPVVGVVLVHAQREYGSRGRHAVADAAIRRLVRDRELAAVPIDTALDGNRGGLRTPAEIESLIARMDAVVTTRLHGLALALGAGVPALAIDPIAGGAKVLRQARALGWPFAFTADALDDAALARALDACLAPGARHEAMRVRRQAAATLAELPEAFLGALRNPPVPASSL